MKRQEKQKGITLVALVVTIIILLILAGVALAFTFGNDGIINKSKEAVEKHNQAVTNEKKDLEQVEDILQQYMNTGEQYKQIKLDIRIGKFGRQKASYLKTTLLLEELNEEGQATGNILTLPIGVDGKASISGAKGTFQADSFHMDLVQKGTKASYANIGTFSNAVITGNVKQGASYQMKVMMQVGRIDSSGQKKSEIQERYNEVIAKEETQKTFNSASTIILDMDNDGSIISIEGDNNKKIWNSTYKDLLAPYTKILDSKKYICLMDEKGDPVAELEDFIGFDVNRDGYLSDTDSSIIQLHASTAQFYDD